MSSLRERRLAAQNQGRRAGAPSAASSQLPSTSPSILARSAEQHDVTQPAASAVPSSASSTASASSPSLASMLQASTVVRFAPPFGEVPTVFSLQRQDAAAKSYTYSLINFEEEYQGWLKGVDGKPDAAAEALAPAPDDLREISRERLLTLDSRAAAVAQSGGIAGKPAVHFHTVQTALRLYSSDWRGIERYYKNTAIRPDRSPTPLAPPLFESGPNVALPADALDEDDSYPVETRDSEVADALAADSLESDGLEDSASSEPAADRLRKHRYSHKYSPSTSTSNDSTRSPAPTVASVALDPSPALDPSWSDPVRPVLLLPPTPENGETAGRGGDENVPALPRPARHAIFSELYSVDDPPEVTLVSQPYVEKPSFRFLFEPKELSFGLVLGEPFFCSAALYDMGKRLKISENFDFDLNAPTQIAAISPRQKNLTQKALFSVSAPSPDIWLVVRVEKIPLADAYDAIVEPYSKYDSLKDKDRERLVAVTTSAASRLGRFRTPFVWTLIPIFNDEKQLALGMDAKLTSFYRWKPELGEQIIFDTYAEYWKAGSSSKRTRNVSGRLVFDVQLWTSATELALAKLPHLDAEGNLAHNVNESASAESDPTIGRSRSSSAPPTLAAADSAATAISASAPIVRDVLSFLDDSVAAPFTQLKNSLFVYPLCASLSKVTSASGVAARNISVQVQLLEIDDPSHEPLDACFNKNALPLLCRSALTSVQYHERSPVFHDELKLSLPLMITSKHNLLFTFYHVACKTDEEAGDVLTPVGYAFMPLLFRGRFLEKEITLPIASSLPKAYMSPEGEAALRTLIFDSKKTTFKFRLKLVSSVYTSDKHLNAFFSSSDNPTRESLRSLLSTSVLKSIQFLPTILNLILHAMSRNVSNVDKEGPTAEAFDVLIEFLHRVHSSGDVDLNALLLQYIDHVFMQQPIALTSGLYRVFSAAWAAVLEKAAIHGQIPGFSPVPSGSDPVESSGGGSLGGLGAASTASFAGSSLAAATVGAGAVPGLSGSMPQAEWERLHRFAGFFLRVISKSMASFTMYGKDDSSRKPKKREKDLTKDKPHRRTSSSSVRLVAGANSASPSPVPSEVERRERFELDFLTSLRRLIVLLTWEVQLRMRSGLTLAKEIIKKLASFFADLASVCDRGFVLDLVHHVVDEQLTQYPEERLEFLRVLSNYEHFALLNLPVSFKLDQSMISNLDVLWKQRHFLAHSLCKLSLSSTVTEKPLRMKALGVLHTIFFKHDADSRMRSKKVKQKVLRAYWPLVVGAVDSLDDLRRADFDEQRATCLVVAYILRHVDRRLLSWWWRRDTFTRQVGFLQLLGLVSHVFEHVGERLFLKRMSQSSDQSKTSVQTKAMLEAYFTDPQGSSRSRYQSLREKRLAAARQSSTSNVPLSTRSPEEAGDTAPSGTWGRRWKHTFGSSLGDGTVAAPYDEIREACLSQEIGFVICDVLALYVEEKSADLSSAAHPNLLMDALVSTTVSLLQRRFSVVAQLQTLASLRGLVHQYPKQLFTLNNTYCAVLCAQMLSLCQYHNVHVRSEATALLFLLMKKNYEHSSSFVKKRHFSRVKVQSIIALSKLVGGGRIKEPAYLLRSLQSLERYALLSSQPTSDMQLLSPQVALLVERLRTIMEDSVKINLHRNDPEMLADLYHRIAGSYRNAPDLRVTWLESLAEIHAHATDSAAWAEAAQCRLHIAALVAEYLDRLEPVEGLPPGCSALEPLCPSAAEEQEMLVETFRGLSDVSTQGSDRLGDGLDGGVDEAHLFTEATLVSVCEGAATYLTHAQLFEAASDVLKLLVRIHDKNRDHSKLSAAYADLSDLHRKIREADLTHSRVLGSYYRVAFFGPKLPELDGQEFIYKEPRLTRLGEICDRLTTLFTAKLGPQTPVELYTKSGEVDRNKLDASKFYLQITSVIPYFEDWELKDRKTDFERNFNVSHFIFETPFTKSGKAHAASLAEQFKLRTILSVEAAFPYMKKRLRVVAKRTEEVTPLDNSLDLLKKRNNALKEELLHPTAKTLQPVLQGSVRLQVHAGPTEICRTFLSEPTKYPERSVQELRRCLQEFLDVCGEALSKNRELITTAQLSFHQELEEGFVAVRATMEPYLAD